MSEFDEDAPLRRERLDLPSGAVPLEEHVPPTPEEIGLELDLPDTSRRRWVLAGAAAAVVLLVLAWFVLRGDDDVDLVSLDPGECFEPARARTDVGVQRVGCDTPHDAELVVVLSHPAARGESYPGDEQLALYGEAACAQVAPTRTGKTFDALLVAGADILVAVPDADAWDEGDRAVVCSLVGRGRPLDHKFVTE